MLYDAVSDMKNFAEVSSKEEEEYMKAERCWINSGEVAGASV